MIFDQFWSYYLKKRWKNRLYSNDMMMIGIPSAGAAWYRLAAHFHVFEMDRIHVKYSAAGAWALWPICTFMPLLFSLKLYNGGGEHNISLKFDLDLTHMDTTDTLMWNRASKSFMSRVQSTTDYWGRAKTGSWSPDPILTMSFIRKKSLTSGF